MAIMIKEISDEPLKYYVDVHGESIITTVTSSPSVVRNWLGYTIYEHTPKWALPKLVVGLGVNWVPKSSPEAATLQLYVGHRCLIYQLTHTDTVPNLLRHFLLHPNNTFVGMWNHSDRKMLMRSEHALRLLEDPVDLRHYVRSGKSAARETIIEECLGWRVRFDKGVGRSDWDDYDLSERQVMEATVDAYASFAIGKSIKAWRL